MDMGSFQSEFHVVPQEFNQFVNHLPLYNASQMHRVKGWLKSTNLPYLDVFSTAQLG